MRSTSGGPSESSTAATFEPIASIAKTALPPSTSVKYFRSPGTSADGVYRKSSPSNGGADSATAGHGRRHVSRIALGPVGAGGSIHGSERRAGATQIRPRRPDRHRHARGPSAR